MREARNCPFEDAVLFCFVDAVVAEDSEADAPNASMLASHLEDCPQCRRALAESKSLDALLASQTRTDLGDEDAERLLAFRAPASRPGRARKMPALMGTGRARRGKNSLVGLAALLVFVLLLMGYERSSRESRVPLPAKEGPTKNDALAVSPKTSPKPAAEQRSSIFSGPGISIPSRPQKKTRPTKKSRRRVAKPTSLDYLASFTRGRHGSRSRRISARQLFEEAEKILGKPFPTLPPLLQALSYTGRPRPRPTHSALAEERMSNRDALALAAAGWVLDAIAQGRRSVADLRLPVEELLLAEGLERRLLLRRFRDQEQILVDWLAGPLERRSRRQDPAALYLGLIAAVGLSSQRRALLAVSDTGLMHCARQARLSADRQSLSFLVDLYLDLSLRYPDRGARAERWFADLSPSDERIIQGLLEERIARSRHFDRRQICLRLLGPLGLGLEPAHSADSPR